MFPEFIMENPNVSAKTFDTLAKLFKEKADGKHSFPKLPTMLKSYYKTWEKNSGMNSTEHELDQSVNALLKELFNTCISSTTGKLMPSTETILQQHNADINIDLIDNSGVEGGGMTENQNCSLQTSIEEADNEAVLHSEPTINVPPIQAASQIQYIPANNNLEVIAFRCAWYPKCLEPRAACKGRNKSECMHFKHRIDDNDFIAEMMAEKPALKRKRHKEAMRIERKNKQQQNQI